MRQSHTPETVAQEVAALVVATALPARALANAAGDAVPGLRISFVKSLGLVRALWLTLDLSGLTFDRSPCSGLRLARLRRVKPLHLLVASIS